MRIKKMVRRDGRDTSLTAASRLIKDLNDLQHKVFTMLRANQPIGDYTLHLKCCKAYGHRAESTYRKRRSELTDLGLVVDSGMRAMDGGSTRILWITFDKAAEAPAQLAMEIA